MTLGLVLILWLVYRIVWSLLARKPRTFTHTQVVTPETFEWPFVPGDTWMSYGLTESGHWVVLCAEFREPEWITSRERAEYLERRDEFERARDARLRQEKLRHTRVTYFDQP